MVCANCGLNNIDGSNFCIGCGHALKAAASDSYVVLVSDLPDSCRARLLEAVKNPPPETFVISESKSGWAMATLIGSVFGIFIVVAQANAYKWQQEEVLIYLAVTVGCFVAGLSALRYLLRFFGADFRAHALINPLYFLRIRFGRIDVVSLLSPDAWRVSHKKDLQGNYGGSISRFGVPKARSN